MSEKLYNAKCRIHGTSKCELCLETIFEWNDKKRRSKRRRNKSKEVLKESKNDDREETND